MEMQVHHLNQLVRCKEFLTEIQRIGKKTIGAHYVYGVGYVTIDPETEKATMQVTFYTEDMYNFNPGQADIASGTPDAVNGRFAELGWAKEFKTTGSITFTETWQMSKSPTLSGGANGGTRLCIENY